MLLISIIRFLIALIFLVIVQLFVLNNINDSSPQLFILSFILLHKYPKMNLIVAFLIGLFMDVILSTGGVYALASICIMVLRIPIVKKFIEVFDHEDHSYWDLSVANRIIYFSYISLCFCFLINFVGQWVVYDWKNLIENFLIQSLTTFATIFIVYMLFYKKTESFEQN